MYRREEGRAVARRGVCRCEEGRVPRTRCLTATCDKWENGKSISSIDTGHASIEHGAKTDSDLARPSGGDHPATQQASSGVPTRSAARRGRSAARHAHLSANDSGVRQATARGCCFPDDSEIEEDRAGGGGLGPAGGGRGVDPGRRRLSGVLAEHPLIG